MPKRKRLTETSARNNGRTGGGRANKRLQLEVANARKQLQRAFKLAKGFERQKLGRRKKAAVKDGNQEQAARIDAEVEAWKGLEPPVIAASYLIRLFEREKALRSSEHLLGLCQSDRHIPSDHATTTVAARLYNSNPVKTVVSEVLPLIRAALGVKDGTVAPTKRRKSEQGDDLSDQMEEEGDEDSSSDASIDEERGSLSGPRSTIKHDDQVRDAKRGADPDINSDDENGFDELEKQRLGSDSDSGSSIDFEALRASGKHRRPADLSISSSGSDKDTRAKSSPGLATESDSDESREEEPPVISSRDHEMFVPTLSMGGYISGSESSASDIDEEVAPPRKNRRGQRARQKIWEAKYGQKAKHLQDGSLAKGKGRNGRDSGWDTKRGATSSAGKEGWRPGWARQKDRPGGREQATGSNAVSVKSRSNKGASKKDEKPLHPSWEAKIKAKQKSEPGIGSFAGSKMTFD